MYTSSEPSLVVSETPEPEAENALRGKKILWVEDDTFLADIIEKKLKETNCTLWHATSGESALEITSKEVPDLIVVDLVLPGMDGFEIMRRLKADPKTKDKPMIILSNLSDKADIQKGEDSGAVFYLVKAMVTLDDIISKLGEVFEQKKA